MKYRSILAYFAEHPYWAITRDKLDAIEAFLAVKMEGGKISAEEIEAVLAGSTANAPRPTAARAGDIAVIPLQGTIVPRGNLQQSSGMTGLAGFRSALAAATQDPNIKAIVLDIDSPGGNVMGLPETAQAILDAREKKHIVGSVSGLCCSAAYWLGSNATELYASPSSLVGSIGVITSHTDISKALETAGVKVTNITAGKFKGEGSPHLPLTEEALAASQARIDEYYDMFTGAVAKGRDVPNAKVRDGFGQGRALTASSSKAEGMIDGIATMDDVLRKLGAGNSNVSVNRSASRARELELLAK